MDEGNNFLVENETFSCQYLRKGGEKMKEKKMDIEQIKEITGLTTQEIDIL